MALFLAFVAALPEGGYCVTCLGQMYSGVGMKEDVRPAIEAMRDGVTFGPGVCAVCEATGETYRFGSTAGSETLAHRFDAD